MQTMHAVEEEVTRLERVARNRVAFWTATVMSSIGLLAFVVLFNLFLPNLGDNLNDAALIGLGVAFSLVPAGLWLGFFYRLDRLEPEPKQMVISVFALGLLMTAALYRPVLQGIFQVDSWLYEHWWARLLGGVLVVGYFEQWLVYLTVRYSVFEHPEFDERIDGVIYAIAAGLGMATVLNFFYVIDRGGVDLDIGSIRMVVNALAFASFAGLLGYFMGQARFESTPITYLPTGLTLAALLNGLFFFALEQTGNNGLSGHPWRDLIWAALLAVVTLLLLFWLMARANEETLRLAHSRVQLPATQPASESLPAPVKENGA